MGLRHIRSSKILEATAIMLIFVNRKDSVASKPFFFFHESGGSLFLRKCCAAGCLTFHKLGYHRWLTLTESVLKR